jgi:hypothetical protein
MLPFAVVICTLPPREPYDARVAASGRCQAQPLASAGISNRSSGGLTNPSVVDGNLSALAFCLSAAGFPVIDPLLVRRSTFARAWRSFIGGWRSGRCRRETLRRRRARQYALGGFGPVRLSRFAGGGLPAGSLRPSLCLPIRTHDKRTRLTRSRFLSTRRPDRRPRSRRKAPQKGSALASTSAS